MSIAPRGEPDPVGRDTDLIGGSEKRDIVLVPYDPSWPARFDSERDRIRAALGDACLGVEHVGSTSVEGLPAKPIIDILVAVADVEVESDYVPPLESAGYVVRVRQPGRRMLRTPALDVHVHVCSGGSPQELDLLAFRDRLRASPHDRALYASVKQDLARRDWPTMNHYAAAKTDVIRRILRRAPGQPVARETGVRPTAGRTPAPDVRT
jgi:GrpB-like predicted nucleotidyltransferase (UPF0157 family)